MWCEKSQVGLAVESLGYPERVRSVGTSVAATWKFQAGCVCDCASIRLDQVSSAWQVVQFVGMCADMLRMSWGEEVRLGVICNSVGEVVRSERVSGVWGDNYTQDVSIRWRCVLVWHEDGLQWPKHVVRIINRIQRQLCFDVPTPSLICIKHNGVDASKE